MVSWKITIFCNNNNNPPTFPCYWLFNRIFFLMLSKLIPILYLGRIASLMFPLNNQGALFSHCFQMIFCKTKVTVRGATAWTTGPAGSRVGRKGFGSNNRIWIHGNGISTISYLHLCVDFYGINQQVSISWILWLFASFRGDAVFFVWVLKEKIQALKNRMRPLV